MRYNRDTTTIDSKHSLLNSPPIATTHYILTFALFDGQHSLLPSTLRTPDSPPHSLLNYTPIES
mgnify:CR=1 FL=1